MWQAIIDYWQLSIAFVVISIITVFVCIKAAKASKKTRAARDIIVERLKYENKVRNDFKHLTPELVASAEAKVLVDGIALNIQADLEKESDMNAAFDRLTQPRKYIYALYYVLSDGAQKLSEFFKMNGKPLTDYAGEAVELIFGCKAKELYKDEFAAYDEDNEEVSLIIPQIEEKDAAYALLMEQIEPYALAAAYIKQNPEQFIRR